MAGKEKSTSKGSRQKQVNKASESPVRTGDTIILSEAEAREVLVSTAFEYLLSGTGEYTIDETERLYPTGLRKVEVSAFHAKNKADELCLGGFFIKFFNHLDTNKATEVRTLKFGFKLLGCGYDLFRSEYEEQAPFLDLIPIII